MNKRASVKSATMADIGRLAGVSASTVSRALAGSALVPEAKRGLIAKLAKQHGYVVNSAARGLRLQRTQTISVAIPLGHEAGQTLSDPFFVEMIGHLADEITLRGYSMLLQTVRPPMDDWLPAMVSARRSDGIIVIGQSTEHETLERVATAYQPLVVWGGHFKRQRYCCVGSDNLAGARLATEHLLATGRRRLVFLGDPSAPEIGLRHEGFAAAAKLAKSGVSTRTVRAHLTADMAYEAMRAFIRTGAEFDAVLAASDVVAISAIRAIVASGRSVPGDVAVVGFDDITLAAHSNPPLTTVRQNLHRGAHMLVDLLLQRLAGVDAPSATMPAELVIRESSGPPRVR